MSTAGEISGMGTRQRATDGSRLYRESRCYPRVPNEWYTEPPWTIEALFDAEPFVGNICDPCCGVGTIIEAASRRGHRTLGCDIVNRSHHCGVIGDFLDFDTQISIFRKLDGYVDNLIFNPPFSIAVPLILEALASAQHKVAVLLPNKFLFSQTRYPFFTDHPPARIYFLSSRPSIPPGDLLLEGRIKASGGKSDYCCGNAATMGRRQRTGCVYPEPKRLARVRGPARVSERRIARTAVPDSRRI